MSGLSFSQVNSKAKIHFSKPKYVIQKDGELNLKVCLQDLIKSYLKNLLKHWAKDHLPVNLRQGNKEFQLFPRVLPTKAKERVLRGWRRGLSWLGKQNNSDMLEHCGCATML